MERWVTLGERERERERTTREGERVFAFLFLFLLSKFDKKKEKKLSGERNNISRQ